MPFCDAVVDRSHPGAEGQPVNGSRVYRCLADALADAPTGSRAPYFILVRCGRYYEKLIIDKPHITLIGENRDGTILTFDDAAGTPKPDGTTYGTTGSASVTVRASDLVVRNMTIENGFDYPANASKGSNDPSRLTNAQAVALKTEQKSDQAFFRNVKFASYQDTLYLDAGRHYLVECTITGHIDFIFGAGQAVFDRCELVSRERRSGTGSGYVTAASTRAADAYGFLFIDCWLKKEHPDLADGSVALGRPWHPTRELLDGTRAADPAAVGSVAFKNCWMDSHISEKGWEPMSGRGKDGSTIWFDPADARFFEYGSTGPGAHKTETRRVLSPAEAQNYSIENLLKGWNPPKCRVATPGLQ